jgi:hypothetical protein
MLTVGLLREFTRSLAATGWFKSRGSLLAFFLACAVTTVANWTFAIQVFPFGKLAEIDHEQYASRTRAVLPWGDCRSCNVASL